MPCMYVNEKAPNGETRSTYARLLLTCTDGSIHRAHTDIFLRVIYTHKRRVEGTPWLLTTYFIIIILSLFVFCTWLAVVEGLTHLSSDRVRAPLTEDRFRPPSSGRSLAGYPSALPMTASSDARSSGGQHEARRCVQIAKRRSGHEENFPYYYCLTLINRKELWFALPVMNANSCLRQNSVHGKKSIKAMRTIGNRLHTGGFHNCVNVREKVRKVENFPADRKKC